MKSLRNGIKGNGGGMGSGGNLILEKTFDFSLKVIGVYKYLIYDKKEYVMSKQLLRSATSIGANAVEADAAQSYKKINEKWKMENGKIIRQKCR